MTLGINVGDRHVGTWNLCARYTRCKPKKGVSSYMNIRLVPVRGKKLALERYGDYQECDLLLEISAGLDNVAIEEWHGREQGSSAIPGKYCGNWNDDAKEVACTDT